MANNGERIGSQFALLPSYSQQTTPSGVFLSSHSLEHSLSTTDARERDFLIRKLAFRIERLICPVSHHRIARSSASRHTVSHFPGLNCTSSYSIVSAMSSAPTNGATSSIVPINLSVNNAIASSPIHKLPAELIEDICHYIMPPEGWAVPCVRHHCWTLSEVCQSWRKVVLSSARLWRNIDVHVPVLAQLRDPVALLSLVLSRTSQADLFIAFDDRSPMDAYDDSVPVAGDGSSSELALTLLEMLIARSSQWHTVRFIALDTDCARALAGVRGRLPRLFRLEIPWTPAVDGITHFTEAPRLKEMSIKSADEDVPSRFPLQDQLVTFDVEGSAYDSSLVALLRECSDLKGVMVKFVQSSPPVKVRVTSELAELFFAGDYHDLTLVDLPKLNTLRIGDREALSLETALPSLLNLLKYSHCPLDYLELVNCDLSVGSLTKILELLPSLTELVIVFEFVPMNATAIADVDRALSTLMTDLGKVNLIPELKTLLLIFYEADVLQSHFTFFRPREVATMLGGRNEQSQLRAYCQFDKDLVDEDGWQRKLTHD
ncbi:hypothetical protein BDZ89DRAFT_1199168 [Hymenopellis radicata]|nr:hypothetical protein BDZ89DRAFT_1199168 [Hymenopellis radicata]